MTHLYYDKDADLSLLQTKRVAVLGYGSQGHAHALNLHDNGVPVRVGLRTNSESVTHANQAGLLRANGGRVSSWANVLVVLVPDAVQPEVFERHVRPQLNAGDTLVFAHGFNVHFGHLDIPKDVDVVLVAPKGPGHRVRKRSRWPRVPALFAVHQDVSGTAEALALAYAAGLGAGRAGILRTTFAEETETDLLGSKPCSAVVSLNSLRRVLKRSWMRIPTRSGLI